MQTTYDIAALRRNYALRGFSKSDALPDPFEQFRVWFEETVASQLLEPNAMTLATASPSGKPSARTVLLKGFDSAGFVFFTNYESQKAQDLSLNPQAAILFTWLELERQIRIEGRVEKITRAENEAYFIRRPRGSQISAWASPQSLVIAGRSLLEDNVELFEEHFIEAKTLPLPPFWGGFRVVPQQFEFWQGRRSRLHDRLRYAQGSSGEWTIERLAP